MKDVNFLEINKYFDQNLVKFDKNEIEKYEKIIKADSLFLKRHGLMDYSLLLVIETIFPNSNFNLNQTQNRGQI